MSRLAALSGLVCLLLGGPLATASRQVFDSRAFGERAAASLSDPGVSAFLSDRIAGAVVARSPDLVAIRPLLVVTTGALLDSAPLRSLVQVSATRSHEAALSERSRNVVLSLPDLEVLLRSALREAGPALAAKIPEGLDVQIASLAGSRVAGALVGASRLGTILRRAALGLLVAGTLLVALALAAAPDRRRAAVEAGLLLLLGGLALAAALPAGGLIARTLTDDPLAGAALQGAWRTFMAGLGDWGTFLAGVGLVLAAGGTSLLESVDPVALLGRVAASLASTAGTRAARALRGSLLLIAGLLVATGPHRALAAAAVLLGLVGAFLGVRELFRLVLGGAGPTASAAPSGRRTPARRAVLAAGLALALGVGWGWSRFGAGGTSPPPVAACNGSPDLCGRRVEDVVFAGAHNAMSNTAVPGWMFPHHEASIRDQLRDGIRAFLLDVHYGYPGGERIETDLSAGSSREKIAEAVGAEGAAAAERIRDRLIGVDRGRRGVYLCHGFCELGAYELAPVLREIRDFLLANPGEVLILLIEDYVSPQDIAAEFERAGVASLAYRGSSGPPWPRLRDLVASGERVLCFTESGKPGVPWLRPAFEAFEETPYRFRSPEEFSCRPNRGGTSGSLLLVNHWIETTPAPRPSNAAVVNAYAPLLARARRCAAERGSVPNVVAVDFYGTGDLLRVVEELNRRPAR